MWLESDVYVEKQHLRSGAGILFSIFDISGSVFHDEYYQISI